MSESDSIDRIRDRWRRYLGHADLAAQSREPRAGLAERTSDLSTQILILPSDPFAIHLDFDDATWEWWDVERQTPFGVPLHWNERIPTLEAAALVRTGSHGWDTYMALHRHGGLEVGAADAYEVAGTRAFRLTRAVGLLWTALGVQAEVLEHIALEGQWRVSLSLYSTEGALLGDLAEGWMEPGPTATYAPQCPEENVVIVDELGAWPGTPERRKQLAFRFGGRIEDAWGVRHRRFLVREGQREGEFDPGYWRL